MSNQFKSVDPKQDFVKMEKDLLDFWYKSGIVNKYLVKNSKNKNKFSFLDGPITANNPMGVHHAWGRTYKDLFQRYHTMLGEAQRYQNGFDEQGLWVEVEVEKELGFKNKKDIEKYGIDKFVQKCKERIAKYSKIQTEQSIRLGYFMDWKNSYHTSSDENNYAIWDFLKVCNQKGYLYKGKDSVPWCPRCGTAISQHEILTEEYKEITHKAVYVKYRVKELGSERVKDANLLIWTTTPWTLPSNVAIAVNPDFTYGLWQNINTGEKIIFVRSDLAQSVQRDIRADILGDDLADWTCLKDYKGKDLVNLKYQGLFDDLPALKEVEHRVVAAKDLVNAEEGTGLVHIAPGAGEEDFKLAKEENLQVIPSIDEAANYIEGFADLTGQSAKENPDLILQKLEEKKALFKLEDYTHRYPTCWRCKTELVWRVVDEWYIAMDHPSHKASDGKQKKTLKEQMVEVAKKITWIPSFGLERELDWLKNMHDWLISKKRYWGLALPIWECTKCGNFEVIGAKEELQKRAVEGWDKFQGHTPHRPWIDKVKIKCLKCGQAASRVPDVGNPWLDAGIVPFSTMSSAWFPADFITESFPGQFKNWFYSLIATSAVIKNTNPFTTVLGFASLLDENGEEMHKSKGNAIEFNVAADKIGVDVMRWMYLTQSPANNLLFGYHKADEVRRRFYLIFWNCYKFFVDYANLANWDCNKTPQDIKAKLTTLDKWVLASLTKLVLSVNKHLQDYDAASASRQIEDFIIRDLSTWYIRRSRNRVGANADKDDENTFLSTLYGILITLCKITAPFMPFLADEIYKNLTQEESVHLANFPKGDRSLLNEKLLEEMDLARQITEDAHAKRKLAGLKIRQPLASLSYSGKKLTKDIEPIIADEINVKKVNYTKTGGVKLDTKITKELKEEGEARDIIRQIQQLRKEAGCELNESISVSLPAWPKAFEEQIKKETLTVKIIKSENIEIIRVNAK